MEEFQRFKEQAFCNQDCYREFVISTMYHNHRDIIDMIAQPPKDIINKSGELAEVSKAMFEAGYQYRKAEEGRKS